MVNTLFFVVVKFNNYLTRVEKPIEKLVIQYPLDYLYMILDPLD